MLWKNLVKGRDFKSTRSQSHWNQETRCSFYYKKRTKKKTDYLMEGPLSVISAITNMDYLVNVIGETKVFHINMLQKYLERPDFLKQLSNDDIQEDPQRQTHLSYCQIMVLKQTFLTQLSFQKWTRSKHSDMLMFQTNSHWRKVKSCKSIGWI